MHTGLAGTADGPDGRGLFDSSKILAERATGVKIEFGTPSKRAAPRNRDGELHERSTAYDPRFINNMHAAMAGRLPQS
jgi:hypothetical protein